MAASPSPPELQNRALKLSLYKSHILPPLHFLSDRGRQSERGIHQNWKQAVSPRPISAGKPGLRQEGGKIIKGLNPE